jgi:hypothetical protein
MGMGEGIQGIKNTSSGGFLTPSTSGYSDVLAQLEYIERMNEIRNQEKVKEIAKKLKGELKDIAGEIEEHEKIVYIRESKDLYKPGRVIILDIEYIRVEIADTIDVCNSEKSLIFTDEKIIYTWYDDGSKFISIEYSALSLDLVKILVETFRYKLDLKTVFFEILNTIVK